MKNQPNWDDDDDNLEDDDIIENDDLNESDDDELDDDELDDDELDEGTNPDWDEDDEDNYGDDDEDDGLDGRWSGDYIYGRSREMSAFEDAYYSQLSNQLDSDYRRENIYTDDGDDFENV